MAFKILSNCDDALVSYLISSGAGTKDDVLPSRKSTDKILPVTICKCGPARPHGNPYSGIYEVHATIQVRGLGVAEEEADNEADEPKLTYEARVDATFDAFHQFGNENASGGQLADALSQAASGVAFDNVEPLDLDAGFEAKGDAWVDVIRLLLIARPS